MARAGERSVLAFDFGTKSIGVAIGQELTASGKPLAALKAQDGIPNWQTVEKLLAQWLPDLLVIGLPLNMDGSEQELTTRAKKFANRLHGRFGYPIALQDERLTTVDAKEKLFELGGYKALEKGAVDSLAAALIFESWCSEQV
ncbi:MULTISPECIES: Holliday junction resolvase RuvX [unclassified Agarivorans]|uniref:Holliday junction resolvase RuvX n=1 Tax=unclassified Agarivorans TaxID=2636026 RepID=UPI003D7D3501